LGAVAAVGLGVGALAFAVLASLAALALLNYARRRRRQRTPPPENATGRTAAPSTSGLDGAPSADARGEPLVLRGNPL
jgi:hypothetical protein